MNGYSKIKSRKSKKSPDFSDLPSPPPPPLLDHHSPNHVSKTSPNPIPKTQENSCKLGPDSDEETEKGERFGEILSRACSVSSASRKYQYENKGKLSAVRRAFSLSRSSSVSERYSRIHHQGVNIASPYDHDEENNNNNDNDTTTTTTNNNNNDGPFLMKKKSRKGKILKACKSLFPF